MAVKSGWSRTSYPNDARPKGGTKGDFTPPAAGANQTPVQTKRMEEDKPGAAGAERDVNKQEERPHRVSRTMDDRQKTRYGSKGRDNGKGPDVVVKMTGGAESRARSSAGDGRQMVPHG